jgi:membrane-bound ClpP family serine protease
VSSLNPWLIALAAIIIVSFLAFAIPRVVMAHRHQATTGREELVGKVAVVKRALKPHGMVMFKGELWEAVSDGGPVEVGEQVTINRIEDLTVHVTKK